MNFNKLVELQFFWCLIRSFNGDFLLATLFIFVHNHFAKEIFISNYHLYISIVTSYIKGLTYFK